MIALVRLWAAYAQLRLSGSAMRMARRLLPA